MQIKNICSGDECGDIECKINGDGCAIYDTEQACIERAKKTQNSCACEKNAQNQWECKIQYIIPTNLGWIAAIIIIVTLIIAVAGTVLWLKMYQKNSKLYQIQEKTEHQME